MQENTLTSGNILTSLLRFAIPVFIALFLQAMYGAVDLLVVGRYAQLADLSGVATGSMFTASLTNVMTCFAIGVTVMIGECIGANQKDRAGKVIGNGILLFILLALLAMVILGVFAQPIAVLMHAPQEALVQTSQYIRICGFGFGFIIAYNVLGAIFRGIGDSQTPLLTVFIACVTNVVADLLFVAVFKMGADGAAYATVLAQAVSVVASLWIIMHRELPFSFAVKDIVLQSSVLKKIVLIGAPVALQELLVGFSFIFVQSTVNGIGLVESSAIGVGEKVCAFLMLAASAYMQSMAAFVAQNNGAGKHDRAKKALLYGIETAFAVGFLMALLALFKGDMLASVFNDDPLVVSAAHDYLKAYAVDCLLTAMLFCFIGYFNGCEKTVFVMTQGIVGAFMVRIPLVILFKEIGRGSLFLIGLATPCSSLVQILLCLLAYFRYEHKAS